MTRLLPQSLAGQTVLLLLVGYTVIHVLSMVVYSGHPGAPATVASDRPEAHRIADVARLIGQAPAPERRRMAELADGPTLRVSLTGEDPPAIADGGDPESALLRRFLAERTLAAGITEVVVGRAKRTGEDPHPEHAQPLLVAVRLDDRRWLRFAMAPAGPDTSGSTRAVLSTAVMTIGVAFLSLWGVRRMTRPLRAFAEAADRLGRDVRAPALPDAGPSEVRRAARAFNRMQEQLRRLIDNRTRMLAAISHDLRTPITLLRLRAEEIQDKGERAKTIATLADMEAMIASTLAFARDDAEAEQVRAVDLAALVESLCADMADGGRPVAFAEHPPLRVHCRPLAVKRAVANLVENAVKYAAGARVLVRRGEGCSEVIVDDDGPGIPAEQLEEVFLPFNRLDPARGRETGGVGLGLSVARSIAHGHGGEVVLANREGGGLRATLRLPE
jgi:signal transduction histidine kinase